MPTIQPIQTENAGGPTRQLLETVNAERGAMSNMVLTMAHSPRTLESYLQFNRALSGSKLEPRLREQIALTVAQTNHCDYSLAQHTSLAGRLGLTIGEILASREALTEDTKTNVVLQFAHDLVTRSEECSIQELREVGYADSEIVEIIAQVALNVFENYLNIVAQTDLDFPKVGVKTKAA
ncbi:MAG: alkylhydroperoxidase like protein AhpD family [Bryobacterales bacterium]|nr:alkylhydroperoxidase like protein AhpD family [Bryobacterales bacterium]